MDLAPLLKPYLLGKKIYGLRGFLTILKTHAKDSPEARDDVVFAIKSMLLDRIALFISIREEIIQAIQEIEGDAYDPLEIERFEKQSSFFNGRRIAAFERLYRDVKLERELAFYQKSATEKTNLECAKS